MLQRAFIIFACFIVSQSSFSQGFRARHKVSGALHHATKNIIETSPGSYFATGVTVESVNNVNQNYYAVMGLDSVGGLKWLKKYGNNDFLYYYNDFTNRALYKHGNHVYYAGCVRENYNTQIGVLVKFDFNGDTVWQKIYRGELLEDVIPQRVTASVDGGFLITGFFQGGSNTGSPALLIKTDADGNELWRKKINKPNKNVLDGKAIVQDSATKKIVIAGYQYLTTTAPYQLYDNIVILDSIGNTLSRHNFCSSEGGSILDMIQTKDGGIVAVGYNATNVMNGGYKKTYSYIVKLDINNPAQPLWKIDNYDVLTLANYITCVYELPNGDIVTGGIHDTLTNFNDSIYGYSLANSLLRVARFSKNGALLSARYHKYNDPKQVPVEFYAMLNSLNPTSDGGIIAALDLRNYTKKNPFFFVKFDSNGCDTTLAYCANPTGMKKGNLSLGKIKVYPNPASKILTIENEAWQGDGSFKICITDVLGRIKIEKNLNSFKDKLNIDQLEVGVYSLRVIQNNEILFNSKFMKQD